mmetsp:Transcript_45096/g.113586  ORF Transcript_45096/g.113586 Transcript_45096/m.113586 type:complete len:269 (-) Transcript_45096:1408-2214(-)
MIPRKSQTNRPELNIQRVIARLFTSTKSLHSWNDLRHWHTKSVLNIFQIRVLITERSPKSLNIAIRVRKYGTFVRNLVIDVNDITVPRTETRRTEMIHKMFLHLGHPRGAANQLMSRRVKVGFGETDTTARVTRLEWFVGECRRFDVRVEQQGRIILDHRKVVYRMCIDNLSPNDSGRSERNRHVTKTTRNRVAIHHHQSDLGIYHQSSAQERAGVNTIDAHWNIKGDHHQRAVKFAHCRFQIHVVNGEVTKVNWNWLWDLFRGRRKR